MKPARKLKYGTAIIVLGMLAAFPPGVPEAAAEPYGPVGTLGPNGATARTCSGLSNCYVCATGSCAPSGTWQSRIEGAGPGTTILLRDGTYDPSGTLDIPAGMTDFPIVIAKYNREAPRITGPVVFGNGHVLMEGLTVNAAAESNYAILIEKTTSGTPKQNIELKNLDVLGGTIEAIRLRGNVRGIAIRRSLIDGGRNNHTMKVRCQTTGSCGSLIPENITIENNKFSKNCAFPTAAGEDLLQFEGAGNATVIHNEFGNNPNGEDCVDWKSQGRTGTTIVFSHNLVDDCNFEGILFQQAQTNGTTTIEGNRFFGPQLLRHTHAGTRVINNVFSSGTTVVSADNLTVGFNTFLSSFKFGDATAGPPQGLTLINNIFSGTRFSCTSSGCGSYTASFNVRYQTIGSFTCSNCRTGNPMLTGYVISPSSSALDAASELFAVATDIERTSRPQGPGRDIGAYELAR